ncbi:MAG: chemotaxis protein [Verrucomicrobia bacterium]|nr:chemotaxis protein [Verrucomicrobiota bacterium]
MKSIKLGTKIGAGFALLVSIAIILGALAVWTMNRIRHDATALERENVPEVTVANNVERSALLAMYEIRAFGLIEDLTALKNGRQHLNDVTKYLAEAKKLGASTPDLAALLKAAERAEVKVLEYERLVQETEVNDATMDKIRVQLDQSAQTFLKESYAFLESQAGKLKEELKAGLAADKVAERFRKTELINDVIDAGNACRLAAWRAQAERNPQLAQKADEQFGVIKTKVDEIRPTVRQDVNKQQLALVQTSADSYQKALGELVAAWKQREALGSRRAEVANAVLAESRNTSAQGLGDTAKVAHAATVALGQASLTLIIGLATATVLGIVVGFFLTRSITGPIREVAGTLSAGAQQTAAAAGQVSSASQTLASGASQQAASLEETSSSLEEMASMTKRNADNAHQANSLAREARNAAESGVHDMEAMNTAMQDIKASSDGIAKIIKTIDEIAFQTNILALNAAVEAARAGEAGMGFAVVADEVRNLAQRSAVAAKETADKIQNAIDKTAHGVDLSARVGHTLQEIVVKARRVDELVAEVANASKEQTSGIDQLNSAVGQIDQVTQSNAASAEESASAAEELNAQTECLKEAVASLLAMVNGAHDTVPAAAGVTANRSPALPVEKRVPAETKSHGRPTRDVAHVFQVPAVAAPPAARGQQKLTTSEPAASNGDHADFFKST